MKTRIKKLFKITLVFFFLTLAFNNCGQTGDIKMERPASTSTVDNHGDENGGLGGSDPNSSAAPNSPMTSPPPSPPVVPIPKPPVVVTPPPPSTPVFVEKIINVSIGSIDKVDILFVIDNSRSMNSEQANMAQRFDRFIESLQGLDWQIGIITTDVDSIYPEFSDGNLLKFNLLNTHIINSKMNKDEVQKAFADTIQTGDRGSFDEQGIHATYKFLERESNGSSKLLRLGSSFNVVIVSDADETAISDFTGVPTGYEKNNPLELLKFISKKWPGKNYMFHSIVVKENDDGCLHQSSNEAYGLAYIKLSNLTHGIVGSVCESDYGSQLKMIGQKVKDSVKLVTLECLPMDTDGDGKLNVQIISESSTEVPVIDKIDGTQIYFQKNLAVGNYKVKYFCQK